MAASSPSDISCRRHRPLADAPVQPAKARLRRGSSAPAARPARRGWWPCRPRARRSWRWPATSEPAPSSGAAISLTRLVALSSVFWRGIVGPGPEPGEDLDVLVVGRLAPGALRRREVERHLGERAQHRRLAQGEDPCAQPQQPRQQGRADVADMEDVVALAVQPCGRRGTSAAHGAQPPASLCAQRRAGRGSSPPRSARGSSRIR